MALIKCTECQKDISSAAESCPSCGYPVQANKSEIENPLEKKSSTAYGCGVAIICVVVLFVILAIIGKLLPDKPSAEGDPIMACLMAEDFVKKRLKAPSTAVFGSCRSENTTRIDSTNFMVSNYVDSENSFGAKIRSNYSCLVRYDGNMSWSLISLDGL